MRSWLKALNNISPVYMCSREGDGVKNTLVSVWSIKSITSEGVRLSWDVINFFRIFWDSGSLSIFLKPPKYSLAKPLRSAARTQLIKPASLLKAWSHFRFFLLRCWSSEWIEPLFLLSSAISGLVRCSEQHNPLKKLRAGRFTVWKHHHCDLSHGNNILRYTDYLSFIHKQLSDCIWCIYYYSDYISKDVFIPDLWYFYIS